MDNSIKNDPVKEFYLTAAEYCKLVEYTSEIAKYDFISKAQKILVFVYLKASLLPKPEEIVEGDVEKFVQEEDWMYIKSNVANSLGGSDKFLEILLPENSDPENFESVRLSECFADIYQDLKDFVTNFEIGNPEAIIVASDECLLNFEEFWGQRLLATLSYLHNMLYDKELLEEKNQEDIGNNQHDADTSNWLINQRFEK